MNKRCLVLIISLSIIAFAVLVSATLSITINSPSNTTYKTNTSDFNITLGENFSIAGTDTEWCNYSLDGGANVSMVMFNSTIFNALNINLTEGQHTTIFVCGNETNNTGNSVSFFIDSIVPYVVFISPANIVYGASNITINISTSGAQSVWFYNGTANETYTNAITRIYADGQYTLIAYANDSAGNFNSSSLTFRVDTIHPIITLISPDNDDTWDSSNDVQFKFNVSDISIANCSLIVDDGVKKTDTSIDVNDDELTITDTLDNGYYDWYINCTDNAGNTNSSSVRELEVDYEEDEDSSGGGGADEYWTVSYYAINDKFKNESLGYTRELGLKQRLRFLVNSIYHSVGVIEITSATVTINVSSTPQTATLTVGETKKFDVTTDGFYDIIVKLNKIANSKANITISSVSGERVIAPATTTPTTNTTTNVTMNATIAGDGEEEEEKAKNAMKKVVENIWTWIIVVIVIALIVLGVYYREKIAELLHRRKIIKENTWHNHSL